MSQRDDDQSLRDMLSHAREAVSLTHGRSRADLDDDRVLYLSVTRLIEIVGEAARRVSAERRSRHPELPWREIVGMRDRIAHGYDIVDRDIVWVVVNDDLPPLIGRLQRIIQP